MAVKRVIGSKAEHKLKERAKTKAASKALIESAHSVPEMRLALKELSKYVFGEDA